MMSTLEKNPSGRLSMTMKYIPALCLFCFMVLLIYMKDTNNNELIFFHLAKGIPFGDKLAHFLLFGLFAGLLNYAWDFKYFKVRGSIFFLASTLVCVVALLEEFTQLFLPSRTFDLLDITADFLGICFFTWWFRRHF